MYAICHFLSIFLTSYLGHLSLLGLQTKTRRQRNSSAFYSSPITRRHSWVLRWSLLCMLLASAHKEYLTQKGVHLVPLDRFPSFMYYLIALVLLYNIRLEQSFSMEQFQSYTASKNQKRSVQLCGIFHIFLTFYRVSDNPRMSYKLKCRGEERSLWSSKFLGRRRCHPDGYFLCSQFSKTESWYSSVWEASS